MGKKWFIKTHVKLLANRSQRIFLEENGISISNQVDSKFSKSLTKENANNRVEMTFINHQWHFFSGKSNETNWKPITIDQTDIYFACLMCLIRVPSIVAMIPPFPVEEFSTIGLLKLSKTTMDVWKMLRMMMHHRDFPIN